MSEVTHGPLIRFSYNLSTNGMMMGSGSFSGDSVEWHRDGRIILSSDSEGGGKRTYAKYSLKPEAAEKIRGYVTEKKLAEIAGRDIPTPMVYDCFTSSTIGMGFDDSSVGGSYYESVTLYCGPAGMTFRQIEEDVAQLLKECRETGECIEFKVEEKKNGMAFPGMPGMAMSPLSPAQQEGWTCIKCGQSGNTGKYCTECGSAKNLSVE